MRSVIETLLIAGLVLAVVASIAMTGQTVFGHRWI